MRRCSRPHIFLLFSTPRSGRWHAQRHPHPGLAVGVGGFLDRRGFARAGAALVWVAALTIEYISPRPGSGPGTGAVVGRGLDRRGGIWRSAAPLHHHRAGEAIVVDGDFCELTWTPENVSAFLSLVGSIAMWWIYFDKGPRPAPN